MMDDRGQSAGCTQTGRRRGRQQPPARRPACPAPLPRGGPHLLQIFAQLGRHVDLPVLGEVADGLQEMGEARLHVLHVREGPGRPSDRSAGFQGPGYQPATSSGAILLFPPRKVRSARRRAHIYDVLAKAGAERTRTLRGGRSPSGPLEAGQARGRGPAGAGLAVGLTHGLVSSGPRSGHGGLPAPAAALSPGRGRRLLVRLRFPLHTDPG